MNDSNYEESRTTVFPVTMYKVSKEWIDMLFNEVKRNILSKAIECNCDKDFLANLNELKMSIGTDSTVELHFPKKENPAPHEASFEASVNTPAPQEAAETPAQTEAPAAEAKA